MYLKISKYISVAVISLLLPFASYAQQTESEKAQQTVEDLTKKEAPVFGGVALSGEIVFGIETRIWKIFHLGWNVRYKIRMSHSEAPQGSPWYVPGFGKYGNSCIGGTFNIIFDI